MTTVSKYPKLKAEFNDKTGLTSTFISGRKLGPNSTILKAYNFNSGGVATVSYSKELSNSFNFVDKKDFLRKVAPCIEKELLDEFGL